MLSPQTTLGTSQTGPQGEFQKVKLQIGGLSQESLAGRVAEVALGQALPPMRGTFSTSGGGWW